MKKKNSTNKKLVVLVILLIPFSLLLGFEINNIMIDIHSFKEFERARAVLDTLQKDEGKFHNIKQFNKIYGLDIKPMKNCYIINAYNGEYPYGFGFKLESFYYRFKYQNWYFVYPTYNWPYSGFCDGGVSIGGKPTTPCYDKNKEIFERFITRPCDKIRELNNYK